MTHNINEILRLPANKGYSSRGADMGRRGQCQGEPEKLHLQQVRLDSGGYDAGGAYWGWHKKLYCATSPATTTNEEPIMVFVRANNRTEAKAAVLETIGNDEFTFLR